MFSLNTSMHRYISHKAKVTQAAQEPGVRQTTFLNTKTPLFSSHLLKIMMKWGFLNVLHSFILPCKTKRVWKAYKPHIRLHTHEMPEDRN